MMFDTQQIIYGSIAIMLPVGSIIVFVFLFFQKQKSQQKELKEMQEAHQRKLLEVSVQMQESVRRAIGNDLHDDIGALLSATRMSLSQAQKKVENLELTKKILEQTQDALNEAINHVRWLSKTLVPSTLDRFGLEIAMQEFAEKMSQHTALPITFTCDGDIPVLEKNIELSLFRTAQELVNNSIKHSQAQHIDIALRRKAAHLLLEVKDDGVGFDLETVQQDPRSGIGLRNMESRMMTIGGQMHFNVALGQPTSISAEVPMA
jgi:signal transduction histidine kinase